MELIGIWIYCQINLSIPEPEPTFFACNGCVNNFWRKNIFFNIWHDFQPNQIILITSDSKYGKVLEYTSTESVPALVNIQESIQVTWNFILDHMVFVAPDVKFS